MKKLLTQFLSWDTIEEFNGKSIQYVFGQKQKTVAMQSSQDAKAFCYGPSSLFMKKDNSDLSEWEGYCAFSFMKHNCRLISNLQIFQLFELNSDVPVNNTIVTRLSTWNKKEDISSTSKNNQWGCFAKTAIIKENESVQVINASREIRDAIQSGITNTCRSRLSQENYSLQIVDPFGISFGLSWGDAFRLPLIETKIDNLYRILNDIEEKNEDYHVIFCVNENWNTSFAP